MSSHRVGQRASDQLLLSDLLRLLAYRTNGKTGFLQAICVYFFCIPHYLERVGLAVYLALLARFACADAALARLVLGVGWLLIMSG